MKLKLNDLTKSELLELIGKYVYSVSDREIIKVRYNSLIRKADAATAEAMTDMEMRIGENNTHKSKPIKNTAVKKYSRAMRLYTKAEKLKSMEAVGQL